MEKTYTLSSCHNESCADWPIYVLEERPSPYDGTGRRQIGHISLCGARVGRDFCLKPQRPPVRHAGGIILSDEAWRHMIHVHPKPPYIFVKLANGDLAPEGFEKNVPVKPVGQDLAAADTDNFEKPFDD